MLMIFIFSCLLDSIVSQECNSNTDEVNKYVKLISEELEKAKNYTFKVDNSEYFEDFRGERPFDFGTYDFIVVGAGSAGSVVANRLSEIEKWNVLLIEAGGDEDDFGDIPAMCFWAATSDRNWGYYTIPQTTCCQGMKNKQCNFPRGKLMGGSSSINAVMFVRGNSEDFNNWERLGNSGWSYTDVLPYFKKFEDTEVGDLGYHSYDGPLHISNVRPSQHPLNSRFEDALLELHQNSTTDYNGRFQLGVGVVKNTMKNGRRMSTARAFLYPIIKIRNNLKIITRAMVTRLLFNLEGNRVYGVEFVKKGTMYRALVDKEVILSAGAVNSPQILILSGIGPRTELKKLNIPLLLDLPVGKYLQDHPFFPMFTIRTSLVEQQQDLKQQVEEYLNGGGTLSIAASCKMIAFVNLNTSTNFNRPDVQLILSLTQVNPDLIFTPPVIFNYDEELSKLTKSRNPLSDFNILISLLHPKSVGAITLKSNSPIDYPNIDLNYFSDEDNHDLDTLYKAIRFLQRLIKTPPFVQINAQLLTPIDASFCQNHEPDSKGYWYCFFQHTVSTTFHPVGTTRMGLDRSTSVVDPKLRVHGVPNLRIADAGVMPEITSGNTNAPTIMIGEKAADLIKESYSESSPTKC